MKTSNREEISQRAQQIWENHGKPTGRDTEIWLKAERELEAGKSDSRLTSTSRENSRTRSETPAVAANADRVKGEMASESSVEYHISPAVSDDEAIKAALQRKEARAPQVPLKTAPKAAPPESGKPLWNKPHSS